MTAVQSWSAWSCRIRLVVGNDRVLAAASRDLREILDRVDRLASRFRCDSVLTEVNLYAGRPVPVSHEFIALLTCALKAAEQTSGLLDPTIGAVLSRWGYDRDIAEVSAEGDPVTATTSEVCWRDVRLNRQLGLVTVPPGAALDFGATAKAFTADYAARVLRARYDTAVLVELGGDIAVEGGPPGGWPITVAENDSDIGDLVTLAFGGIATSTTTLRRWRRGQHWAHHIIDPRTGAPAHVHWRTVTVAAHDAVSANTASTASIILGPQAHAWLSAQGLAARLVHQDGSIHTTERWTSAHSAAA